MTYPAPPSVHRWALRALLLAITAVCALGALTAVGLAGAAPAAATQGGADPAVNASTTPEPQPTDTASPAPSPTPGYAEASLVRSACDTVQLSARTEAGRTLAYRIADEAGRVAASGTFTGSLDAALPVTAGHTYTAHVSEGADGGSLASSASADLREPCPVAVAADAPHFDDQCGAERDAVVVPLIIGVDYRVGEAELAPGANAAHGHVTVEASARPGYALNGPSRWVHAFISEPCPATAPPAVGPVTPASIAPEPQPGTVPPPTETAAPGAAAPSSAAPTVVPTSDATPPRTSAEPSSQTGVAAPGPLAWGIMISLVVAGGVFFWSKTRH
ncbi:hypothetical protein [Sinomonas mesophila]|uniref:hypothetical protein n=1 Tax=Sinomonas mesophila TaxID=1531955 RepID=UPI000984E659|nr:hypothetical protein [Sinomonas mesophila]